MTYTDDLFWKDKMNHDFGVPKYIYTSWYNSYIRMLKSQNILKKLKMNILGIIAKKYNYLIPYDILYKPVEELLSVTINPSVSIMMINEPEKIIFKTYVNKSVMKPGRSPDELMINFITHDIIDIIEINDYIALRFIYI